MGKIKLHIANANNKFTGNEINIIQKAVSKADDFISNNFVFDYEVDLIVATPYFLMGTIPEDGISGRTYNSQLIMLVIDKHQKEISEEFIFETLCHEMSHSLRWEKLPEHSKTLFDDMVFERLAIVLEEHAMREAQYSKKQFFLKEIQNAAHTEIDDIISQLSSAMESEQYNYDTIFYTGSNKLPRWAGYKLGYYFVKKHLEKTDSTIFEAILTSYSKFSSKNK